MKNTALLSNIKSSLSNEEKINHFYNEATTDYQHWSKNLNMHFGYYKPFKTCIIKREQMLNAMNQKVYELLDFSKSHTKKIIDLGCGMGATMQYGLQKFPNLIMKGCTISSFQVEHGNKNLNSSRAKIINSDYRNTPFKTNSFDGAYAIESFCHTKCAKEALLESHRILKPKSKLVIADAFIKKDYEQLNPLSKRVHNGLAKTWKLEGLANISQVAYDLKHIGFKNIIVKSIWYRIAPSVLHAPFVITNYMIKKLLNNETITEEQLENLKGSFYAFLTSLCLTDFGYYIISAEK